MVKKTQFMIWLQGLPASGKSTWAKEKAKENKNTIIVNRDKIREMLKGVYSEFPFGSAMEELVTDIEEETIRRGLFHGYNVISDNTNFRLTKPKIKEYELLYPHVEFSTKFFNVDLNTCIQRDQQRERSVGKEVITRMFNRYLQNETP